MPKTYYGPLPNPIDWLNPQELPGPDNRMVRCVLPDYSECPAKTPAACICYQYQKISVPEFGDLYEQKYRAKYGHSE
jgi:hypothetical protein